MIAAAAVVVRGIATAAYQKDDDDDEPKAGTIIVSIAKTHSFVTSLIDFELSYASGACLEAWTQENYLISTGKWRFIPFRTAADKKMEVSMANYRNGDTASWNTEQVRRSQAEHRPHNSKKRRRKKRSTVRIILTPIVYVICILLVSALLAGVGWHLASDLCAFNQGPETKITVEVTADDDLKSVSVKLKDAGLIEYDWFFRIFGKLAKAEEKIGIGTYELNTEMDYRALIVGMKNSSGNMNAETVTVTIPEGYTVMQTIKLLAEKGVNTEENLIEAAKTATFNYAFIDNDSEDISRLEGYLFPDTYEFYKPEKASDALNRLIKEFSKKLDDELLAEAEARGYKLKDIVIIASLIEEETDGSDHKKIASVIYNRLENVGETANLLQIDAALLYALPEGTTKITNEDKQLDSPYNLYLYKKLPPTAISNPGLKSLEAALQPENTEYYFYALGKDGKHHYSKTLAEHNDFLNSGNYGG